MGTHLLHIDSGEIALDGNGNRAREDPIGGLAAKAAGETGRFLPISIGNVYEKSRNALHIKRFKPLVFTSIGIHTERFGPGDKGHG